MGWQKRVPTIHVPQPGQLTNTFSLWTNFPGQHSQVCAHLCVQRGFMKCPGQYDVLHMHRYVSVRRREKKDHRWATKLSWRQGMPYPSAAMLFEVFMNSALVSNRTTTKMYRNNLAALEVHIGVANSNIDVFDRYVMDNRAALHLERILNAS